MFTNYVSYFLSRFNPLNAKLNPICHLLVLLGAHRIFHVSRIRVKMKIKKKNWRKQYVSVATRSLCCFAVCTRLTT